MMNDETLKIIAILPDLSGVKAIAQLVNQPQKYVFLGSPFWDVVEFVDLDFVTGAIYEHGFQNIQKEIIFRYGDRAKVLSNILPT